jgi:periplasmic copper chaperone A
MKRTFAALLALTGVFLAPASALAHISVASGVGFANTTQQIVFGIGHGCEGADTYSVRIEIPAGVLSVRPLRSDFGTVSVEKNAAGDVIAVVWQKAEQDLLASDISYYELAVRLRVPNQPFTTLYFPTHQTCKASDGTLTATHWVGTPANSGGSEPPEPAPALTVVPARKAGWNKFTVPAAIADLNVFFADAQIVWKGNAAFSANPATLELAKASSGVSELTALQANDEIWVRY